MTIDTKILSAAVLGASLVLAGSLTETGSPVFPAGEAFAGNNGNGKGDGNGGNSANAGNSASAGNRGNSGNNGNSQNLPGGSGTGNPGANGTVLGAIETFLNRGQAKKSELAVQSQSVSAVANSKMKPKDIFLQYGIKPSDVPGGWYGAFMGNMQQKASDNSVHGRAQAALTAFESIGTTFNDYQAALAALSADPVLSALVPADSTFDQDVAARAAARIGELNADIAALDTASPTYDDDLAALEGERDQWQAILDTQTAAQTAQSDFEEAFENVTHGQTPYSEPLAGQVMMVFQKKMEELNAANGG